MSRKISIEIDNLRVHYGDITVLDDISAAIEAGTITALIGPNGAGKTTLLQALLGLVDYSGKIIYRDQDGSRINPILSFVPQKMEFDRGIPMTVYDFMTLPFCHHPLWIPHKKTNRPQIESRLETVSAQHLMFRQFGKLSGGEMQRVMLAMALMNDPEVMLLDEPDAGIDVMGERLFRELLKKIQAEGHITLIMVSHDLSLVNALSDKVICINRKIHCQGKSPEVLTSENLKDLFGGDSGIYLHSHKEGES